MKPRITKPSRLGLLQLMLAIILAFSTSACGLVANSKGSGEPVTPQAGRWMGEFITKSNGGQTTRWEMIFVVSDDSTTVPSMRLIRFDGDSDEGTVLLIANDDPIEGNAFDFSLSEWIPYTLHKYTGTVVFTSPGDAVVTIQLDDSEYQFRAYPSTD